MLKYEIGDAVTFTLFDGEFNRFHSGIIINTSTEDGGKYFVMVENNPANRDTLEFMFKTIWISEKNIVNKPGHYDNIDRNVLESWFPKRPDFRMMTVGYCNCNNETVTGNKELTRSQKEEIDLKTYLLKLTAETEIVLVLQKRDECGGVYTNLRIEGHPDRIIEQCGNSISGYFIEKAGQEYGVYGTRDFVVYAVKEVKK